MFTTALSRQMTRRRFAMPLIVVATLAAAACGGGDKKSTTGPSNVQGTYHITKVNNVSVPVIVAEDETGQLVLTAGEIWLGPNGQYANNISLELVTQEGSQQQGTGDDGTYTVSGSTVTFTTTQHETFTASIAGNVMTLQRSDPDLGNFTFTLVKQ